MPYDGVFTFSASRVGGAGTAYFTWIINGTPYGGIYGYFASCGLGERTEQLSIRAGEYAFRVSYENLAGTILSFYWSASPAHDTSWTGTMDREPNGTWETAVPLAPDTVAFGNVNSQDVTGSDQLFGGADGFDLYKFTLTQKSEVELRGKAVDIHIYGWIAPWDDAGWRSSGLGAGKDDGWQSYKYTLEPGDYRIYIEKGNTSNAYDFTAYELSYSVTPLEAPPPTASVPNIDTAHDWARENLEAAMEAGLIPQSFMNVNWRSQTTRLTVVDAIVQMLEQSGVSRDAYAAAMGWDLNENPFPDVTGSKNLTFLYKAGVVSGGSSGLYTPNQTHSRREAAVLACNIAVAFFGVAQEDVRGPNPFTDVSSSQWYAPYLGYAADNGIVAGSVSNGNRVFRPSERIPNEQTIILMLNAFNHFKKLTPTVPTA
jgi:hypothetical protein